MGRRKINFETIPARFPRGTFEQIAEMKLPNETNADFIRRAVETEIKRRGRRRRRLKTRHKIERVRAVAD